MGRRTVGVAIAVFSLVSVVCATAPSSGAASAKPFYGFGFNGNGHLGTQVGLGEQGVYAPVAVSGPKGIKALAAGGPDGSGVSVAIGAQGTVWTWGIGTSGTLGNGTTASSVTPVQVPGVIGAKAVVSGNNHVLVLLKNGTVLAWGDNQLGELGLGGFTGPDNCAGAACSTTPRQVPGLSNVKAIAAGIYHSVALLKDGTVKAWGIHDQGSLGIGGPAAAPNLCPTNVPCAVSPRTVPGLTGVKAIATSGYHSLAVIAKGQIAAWGSNAEGEGGDGTWFPGGIVDNSLWSPKVIPGLTNVKAVAAGFGFSIALMKAGTLMSWGRNDHGQLGRELASSPCSGSTPCGPTPVAIPGVTGVKTISSGSEHSLALHRDGGVTSWGYNFNGALGRDDATDLPGRVPGLQKIHRIAAGHQYSLAY